VFIQSVGDILGSPGQLFFRNQGPQVSLNDGDSPGIMLLGHRVAQMPEIKQALELAQEPLSKFLIRLVGECGQEFDIPDQMSQTELLKPIGIFGVGREEIRDKRALESFTQDFLQDLGAPGGLDREEAKEPGAEGPDPITISPVFMACLIDMKTGLTGQGTLELLIRDLERRTDRFNLIGES